LEAVSFTNLHHNTSLGTYLLQANDASSIELANNLDEDLKWKLRLNHRLG